MPKHIFLVLLIYFFITSCNNKNFNTKTEKIDFTGEVSVISCKNIKNGTPIKKTDIFSITDIIYFIAYWKRVYGNHKTIAVFFDPNNNPKFPVEVELKNCNGSAISWYWLKLKDSDDLSWARGKWKLYLYFDNKLAKTKEVILN